MPYMQGIFKVIGSPRLISTDADFEDPAHAGDYRVTIQTPKALTGRELRGAIQDAFNTGGGCGHSYDCCGCYSQHAWVWGDKLARIRRGQYQFTLATRRNY